MNRRDFLFLRTTSKGRTLELSCRSLYMRYLDSEFLARAEPEISEFDHEPWMGEPPTVFARRTAEALLRQVEDDLREVDVLRDRKSTRLNSSHIQKSRMPSSA